MFHDPVRVPENAGEGKAKVTVTFSDWKAAKVVPATKEMTIVDAKTEAKPEDDAKATDEQPAARRAANDGISVRLEAPGSEPVAKVVKIVRALKGRATKVELGKAKRGQSITAIIRASADTPAAKVQEMIKALQRAGVESFSLRAKK